MTVWKTMLSLPWKYACRASSFCHHSRQASGSPRSARPFDARRQVADHRVEPDVDPLVRILGVAGDRDAHAPVEVARDRPRRGSSSSRPSEKLRTFGRQPVLRPRSSPQRVGERGQVEEQVVRLAELGRRAVDLRARVDQVGRVELVAAVVALVAARLRVARRSGTSPRCSGRGACARSSARTRRAASARRSRRARRAS